MIYFEDTYKDLLELHQGLTNKIVSKTYLLVFSYNITSRSNYEECYSILTMAMYY